MPARIIRSEINSSDSMARVSMLADLTFRALIVVVDDYGRIDGRVPVLRGLLFPLRPEVTDRKLDAWLSELAAGSDAPIVRYVVDGRPFISLSGWEKHRGKSNRANSSKYPEPDSGRFSEISGDPPVLRGYGVDARLTTDEGMESTPDKEPPAPRSSLCPDQLSDHELALASDWAALKGFTAEQMAHGWERVRDWSHSKRLKRTDWLATLRNAMVDGWALKGFVGPEGPTLTPNDRESAAQARVRRTNDAAREALAMLETGSLGDLMIDGGPR